MKAAFKHTSHTSCVSRFSLLTAALCALLAACTSDTETLPADRDLLQLIPFVRPTEEMTTRAAVIPDGYQPFTEVYKIPAGNEPLSFGIFMTEEGSTPPDNMGLITYQGVDGNGIDIDTMIMHPS